ncbi:MAG: ABC transporter permease [Acidimicrobiia bacterium]
MAEPARAAAGTRSRLDAVSIRLQVLRLAALGALVAVWAYGPPRLVPTRLVSRPDQVWDRTVDLLTSGEFLENLRTTTYEMLGGLLLGGVVGIVLAVLLDLVRPLEWLCEPLIRVLYAIPKVVLVSLFILWFGLDATAKIALVTSLVLFIFFFNMRQALQELDPDRVTALRLMGAGPLKVVRSLVIPDSLPYVFGALRLAVPLAYSGAIFAELNISSGSGLGSLVARYGNALDPAGSVAVILLVALIGYLLDVALTAALRRRSTRIGLGAVL